ncbi:MAG: hypothetical protein AAF211_07300 [Myxococcota bacterium]
MTTAPILAALGSFVSLGAWVIYFTTVPSGRVPTRPVAYLLLQVTALVLSVAGLVGLPGVDGLALAGTVGLGAFGVVASTLFLWLFTQRKTPVGDLRVATGDALLAFTAADAAGEPFDSHSLRGRRVLLKFFRGSW